MAFNSVESVGYSEDAVVWEHDAVYSCSLYCFTPREKWRLGLGLDGYQIS